MNFLTVLLNRQHEAGKTQRPIGGVGNANARRLRRLPGDSSGTILLETVIASIIFSMIGVAVLSGLSNAYYSGAKTETQSVAENTVRNQMEYVFSQPYREPQQTPYPTISTIPSGYTLNTTVAYFDVVSPHPETERITVAATHDGQEILSLETIRGRDDGLQVRYSPVNDRSSASRLKGQTLSGVVYIFLEDPETLVSEARFYLDAFGPLQTELAYPWDFKGGGDEGPTANPWDTDADAAAFDGDHRITAQLDLVTGQTINVTADFSIANP